MKKSNSTKPVRVHQKVSSGNPEDEGYDACNQGIERHRNPYINDSESYELWRTGWTKGFYNE